MINIVISQKNLRYKCAKEIRLYAFEQEILVETLFYKSTFSEFFI